MSSAWGRSRAIKITPSERESGTAASLKQCWAPGQRCVIPAEMFYEPEVIWGCRCGCPLAHEVCNGVNQGSAGFWGSAGGLPERQLAGPGCARRGGSWRAQCSRAQLAAAAQRPGRGGRLYYYIALTLYAEAAYEEVFAAASQGLAWAAQAEAPSRISKGSISLARAAARCVEVHRRS